MCFMRNWQVYRDCTCGTELFLRLIQNCTWRSSTCRGGDVWEGINLPPPHGLGVLPATIVLNICLIICILGNFIGVLMNININSLIANRKLRFKSSITIQCRLKLALSQNQSSESTTSCRRHNTCRLHKIEAANSRLCIAINPCRWVINPCRWVIDRSHCSLAGCHLESCTQPVADLWRGGSLQLHQLHYEHEAACIVGKVGEIEKGAFFCSYGQLIFLA